MRTRSRRRSGWAAAGALALVAVAPTLAQAQQSGLFPLSPIKRERMPCAAEDPVYRLYREQYFGYHPTLWRRFPSGWGMPSPEAPNPAESYRLIPRDVPPDANASDAGDDNPARPGPGGAAAPDGGGRAAPVPGTPNPNGLPPLPSGERSPFDLDAKDPKPNPPPATSPRDGRDATAPEGAGASNPLPELPPVGGEAAASAPVSAPAPDRENRAESPLLAVPDPTIATPAVANTAQAAPMIAPPPGQSGERAGSPFQAPRRTSLIGNLFSGLRRR